MDARINFGILDDRYSSLDFYGQWWNQAPTPIRITLLRLLYTAAEIILIKCVTDNNTGCNDTSSTVTIRVPDELKEKMKNTKVEWSEEIREFIETRINCLELSEAVDEVANRAEKRTTKIDSTNLIREDRER